MQAATDTFKEVFALYALLVAVTACIFSVAEGVSIADSLYWAITTSTSTGYGDLSPKTWIGKIDAALLMLGSIFGIAPLVVVRLVDKLNVNRDAFTHDEQEDLKRRVIAIQQLLGDPVDKLEADMRRYVYDREPGRRIQCLDRYRKRRGLVPWSEMQQWSETH